MVPCITPETLGEGKEMDQEQGPMVGDSSSELSLQQNKVMV